MSSAAVSKPPAANAAAPPASSARLTRRDAPQRAYPATKTAPPAASPAIAPRDPVNHIAQNEKTTDAAQSARSHGSESNPPPASVRLRARRERRDARLPASRRSCGAEGVRPRPQDCSSIPSPDQQARDRVRAEERRVAQQRLDPPLAHRRKRPIRQPVVARQPQRGHGPADGEVHREEQPPVRQRSENRRRREREREPVRQIDHALHPLVTRPEAPRQADARERRRERDEQPPRERRHDPRFRGAVGRVADQQNEPERERRLDGGAGEQRLPTT